jgi:uncharacterized protein YndB with AHSA1/START domain
MAVKFYQHIDINASADTVWRILTNLNGWPMWFPDLEQVTNVVAVESGGTFQWHSVGGTGSGSIVSVEPAADRLKIMTQLDDSQVTHGFEVVRSGGGRAMGGDNTGLRYTMEFDPPDTFLVDFVAGGSTKDLNKVQQTLEKVKGLAEGCV